MYVRWMGVFGSGRSLGEAFQFEMERETPVACEHFKCSPKMLGVQKGRVKIGLLVDPSAVYRRFPGDVWSEYTGDGKLWYTRVPKGNYSECWAEPRYTGIVIRNNIPSLSRRAFLTVVEANREFGLPVYQLVKGKLRLVNID